MQNIYANANGVCIKFIDTLRVLRIFVVMVSRLVGSARGRGCGRVRGYGLRGHAECGIVQVSSVCQISLRLTLLCSWPRAIGR